MSYPRQMVHWVSLYFPMIYFGKFSLGSSVAERFLGKKEAEGSTPSLGSKGMDSWYFGYLVTWKISVVNLDLKT